ncbi:hypothetical protein [Teichococcus aestuarii]|uniref:hypothetical protein n=1 Tax=Teichococcus aestuarii TaxID=568898 RepID=UPI003619D152
MSAPRATDPVPAAGLQRVALGLVVQEHDSGRGHGQGLAAAPGCAESAPLFRSNMPRFVRWQPAAAEAGEAVPEAAEEIPPAMHQALHLCVVEKFQPRRPFGGASKALYRL